MHVDTPPSRKRKQIKGTAQENASKKSKHDPDFQVEKKDKGKGKETAFQVVHSSLVLSIPPIFASNPRTGAEEMLDSMVMRYIPALEGVVLSHSNLTFLDNTASIKVDCPFLVCKIAFDVTVWRPHVGTKLVGKINLCSPDHISLLVHKTFNVSIPRHHIPTDEWEFQYGAAENDPEFGAGAEDGAEGEEKPEHENSGNWIHRVTGSRLGEADGYLEFTVIGMTVANEMLSLLGSIQHDPFSPVHVPTSNTQSNAANASDGDMVENELLGNSSNGEEEDGDEVNSDEDTFQALNKKATAELARRKAEEARKEEEKKQKKKRKAKDVVADGTRKAGKKQKKS